MRILVGRFMLGPIAPWEGRAIVGTQSDAKSSVAGIAAFLASPSLSPFLDEKPDDAQ
jgi:hypothetical protein